MMRYAQKVAVATGCPVQVDLGASAYGLNQQPAAAGHCDTGAGTFNTPVFLPTGEPAQGTAPSGLTLSPALTVRFDPQGRTDLASDQIIAIGTQQLSLSASSGLVTTP